jgi:hypothetical protein
MFAGRQRVAERLESLRSGNDTSPSLEATQLTEEPLPAFWRAVSFLGWALPALMTSENVAWDLVQAGYRKRGAPGLYAGVKVLPASSSEAARCFWERCCTGRRTKC